MKKLVCLIGIIWSSFIGANPGMEYTEFNAQVKEILYDYFDTEEEVERALLVFHEKLKEVRVQIAPIAANRDFLAEFERGEIEGETASNRPERTCGEKIEEFYSNLDGFSWVYIVLANLVSAGTLNPMLCLF